MCQSRNFADSAAVNTITIPHYPVELVTHYFSMQNGVTMGLDHHCRSRRYRGIFAHVRSASSHRAILSWAILVETRAIFRHAESLD